MGRFFGKTWWGEAWLNALSQIDYANRLPRGVRYARNGSVRSIDITGSVISAKVQGSYPSPYKITVTIPAFSPEKTQHFIQSVAAQPALVSKLMNRQLDPLLNELASEAGLNIFPSSWKELSMHCSCPDSAVPCKHLAAVIYKISEQIDINPFLAFELRQIDLAIAFGQAPETRKVTYQPVPDIDALIFEPKTATGNGSKIKRKGRAETAKDNIVQPPPAFKPAYSNLKNITDPLLALLSPAPVFYKGNGDFQAKYKEHFRKITKQAGSLLDRGIDLDRYIQKQMQVPKLKRHDKVDVFTNEKYSVSILLNGETVPLPLLTKSLLEIPPAHLLDYHPLITPLYHAALLTLHLLKSGAVVPQIFQTPDAAARIRWLPAILSKEARGLINSFQSTFTEPLLQFEEKGSMVPVTKDEQLHLLSLMISEWVAILCPLKDNSDDFLQLFFGNHPVSFNGIGESGLSGAIQTWIQRYHMTTMQYRPRILITETRQDDFLLDIEIQLENDKKAHHVALKEVLQSTEYQSIRLSVLQSVLQLEDSLPDLAKYLRYQAVEPIMLLPDALAAFLFNMVPVIELMDIDVLLPKSLRNLLRPKPSMKISAQQGRSYLRLDQMLAFDWQVAIGDQLISEADFKKLLSNAEGLIKYKSQYIYVSKADLQKLHEHFAQKQSLAPLDILRAALAEDYHGAEVSIDRAAATVMKELTKVAPIKPPKGLKATLRPYQLRGFNWMHHNAKLGFGSVIADDMGLGKTLQVIATLLQFKQDGLLDTEKALIVAPTGLLTNWQSELERFAPTLRVQLFHGSQRKIDEDFDILLTSYGTLRSDNAKLKKLPWHSLIIDEAQNIKNLDTRQTKAVRSIEARNFIAMSGTPVENRLSELWSIMDYSNRSLLGNIGSFQENYGKPIEIMNSLPAADKLKKVIAPFMMRRLKTDKTIISDLPDKIEINSYATLTQEQSSLYESTLNNAMAAIEEIDPADKKSLFARKGLVLQLILALKQICNHPTQFLKNKILDSQLSGKMDLLFEKLDTINETGEKVLIFTQFTEMGNLLQHFIEQRYQEKPLFYHGGCTIRQRKAMTEAFQQNSADKIFILSLKAAGTGLNLTAANHVIHFDLWWNPAVEAQATDRAFRIGQNKNVFVYRFITKNTFEEKINDMIQSKKKLADLTVSAGEGWIGNLSNKELKEIFTLEGNDHSSKIKRKKSAKL